MGGREKGRKGGWDDGLSDGDNGEDKTSKRRSLISLASKSNQIWSRHSPVGINPFDTRDVTSSPASYTASPVPSRR